MALTQACLAAVWVLLLTTSKCSAVETLIMTYNLRTPVDKGDRDWNVRRPNVAEIIRKYKPDIIGTQEAHKFMIDQLVGDLGNAVPYAVVGRGREAGGGGETSSILYNKNVWHQSGDFGTFWLSNSPDAEGSKLGNFNWPRICTYARLCLNSNSEQCIWFFNTHFDFQGLFEKQAQIIVNHKMKGKSEPMFLTGDLNVPDTVNGNEALSVFSQVGLADTFRAVHPDKVMGSFNNFAGLGATKFDYVLASRRDDLVVKSAQVASDQPGGKFPSDHCPVLATVCLFCNPPAPTTLPPPAPTPAPISAETEAPPMTAGAVQVPASYLPENSSSPESVVPEIAGGPIASETSPEATPSPGSELQGLTSEAQGASAVGISGNVEADSNDQGTNIVMVVFGIAGVLTLVVVGGLYTYRKRQQARERSSSATGLLSPPFAVGGSRRVWWAKATNVTPTPTQPLGGTVQGSDHMALEIQDGRQSSRSEVRDSYEAVITPVNTDIRTFSLSDRAPLPSILKKDMASFDSPREESDESGVVRGVM